MPEVVSLNHFYTQILDKLQISSILIKPWFYLILFIYGCPLFSCCVLNLLRVQHVWASEDIYLSEEVQLFSDSPANSMGCRDMRVDSQFKRFMILVQTGNGTARSSSSILPNLSLYEIEREAATVDVNGERMLVFGQQLLYHIVGSL